MRVILIKEICKEMPNSSALGAFNSAIFFGASYNTNVAVNEIRGFLNHEKQGNEDGRSLDKIAEMTGTNRDYAIGLVNDFESKDTRKETYSNIEKLTRLKVKSDAIKNGYVQNGFKITKTRKK